MTNLKPYSAYKESGVEWIGAIPQQWNVAATARVSELTTGERDTQDAVEDGDYPFFVRSQEVERSNTYSFNGEGVLTSGDGAGVGKIFHHAFGKFEFHQRVYLFHNFRDISGRYFFYFLREHLHIVALAGNAKSTVDSLRRPMLRMFPVCLPPLSEQTQIARFLDYETAKIDKLIDKQQQLIALLKEKRQAVISHAVTRGLNPDAPMKDSGVEWLGQVPAHWEVAPLKHVCSLIKDGTHLPPPRVDDGVPLLSVRNIQNGRFAFRDDDSMISERHYSELCQSFIPREGDVFMAIVGATLGKVAIVPSLPRFHIQRSVALLRPRETKALNTFLASTLESSGFQSLLWEHVGFSAQPGIYLGTVGDFRVPVPPVDEQRSISSQLTGSVGRLDQLVGRAEQQVELLQERRTALISAAATGKIDVRGWTPPEGADATEDVA